MFDTIIVPLDGSSTAEVAFTYATEMAVRLGSELILLFVKEPHDYRSEHILQCYLDDRMRTIKELVLPLLKEPGINGLNFRTKILTGNPADEIINFSESIPGSHIIMATHGESGVGTRWSLGSIAEKVVLGSTRPVGLIRAERDKPAVRRPLQLARILAPLDGSDQSKVSLPFVREMAVRLSLEVIFLQVIKLEFLYYYSMGGAERLSNIKSLISGELGDLTEQFKKSGIKARYEVVQTDEAVSEKIDEYAKKNDIDLVIMATHGRSGVSRWVLGSVAGKMARQASVPVLLIKMPEEKD